jgi:hypothetical protein
LSAGGLAVARIGEIVPAAGERVSISNLAAAWRG